MSDILLAERVSNLHRSGIRAVMQEAAALERAGRQVVHLEVGQPDFSTPAHIIAAVEKATVDGLPGYTPNAGLPSLREAVAERVSARVWRKLSADNVCVTSGAVMALQLAIMSIVEPGDEVLVPDPGWPNYLSAVTLAGGQPVQFPLAGDHGFAIDVDAIASRITMRTKAIMINSPGNPTGSVASYAEMEALVRLCSERGIFLISDEVYEDFVFGGREHVSALSFGENDKIIVVSGVSKSYAMTGWRIGWMIASPAIVAAAGALVEPLTSCPASASQVAAEAALRGPQDAVEHMRQAYERRAGLATRLLSNSGFLVSQPEGAFYAMIRTGPSSANSDDFVAKLLKEDGVAVAPGTTFGKSSSNCIRISLASSDANIEIGIRKILNRLEAI